MTHEQAKRLAAWVGQHDPATGTAIRTSTGWAVLVGTDAPDRDASDPRGTLQYEKAFTVSDARRILGY